MRNRIISGLSFETVVMQAGVRSGAMTTARVALDSGRDVLVLRHPDGAIGAEGSDLLIEEGAEHFCSAVELLSSNTLPALLARGTSQCKSG